MVTNHIVIIIRYGHITLEFPSAKKRENYIYLELVKLSVNSHYKNSMNYRK